MFEITWCPASGGRGGQPVGALAPQCMASMMDLMVIAILAPFRALICREEYGSRPPVISDRRKRGLWALMRASVTLVYSELPPLWLLMSYLAATMKDWLLLYLMMTAATLQS